MSYGEIVRSGDGTSEEVQRIIQGCSGDFKAKVGENSKGERAGKFLPDDVYAALVGYQSKQDLFDSIDGQGCLTIKKPYMEDIDRDIYKENEGYTWALYTASFCKCMKDECNTGSLNEGSIKIPASRLTFAMLVTLFLTKWTLI